ncbi:MAG TPA: YciI family protein [Gemmatimonadales bacterium]|nr:YciI family protein [Gemmatimonadales bacterium]
MRAAGGKLSVVDGPFAEVKELIGGYAIIRAKSREEAIEHGKQFMSLHLKVLGPSYTGQLEVRQLADVDSGQAAASA